MSVPPLGSSEKYQSSLENTRLSPEKNHPEPEEAEDGFMLRGIVAIDKDNLGGLYSRSCRRDVVKFGMFILPFSRIKYQPKIINWSRKRKHLLPIAL